MQIIKTYIRGWLDHILHDEPDLLVIFFLNFLNFYDQPLFYNKKTINQVLQLDKNLFSVT